MAEDSGAFKTNPRNSARFQQFVMIGPYRCSEASPGKETFPVSARGSTAPIFNKRPQGRCGILKSA
jgi:hypothetical protein